MTKSFTPRFILLLFVPWTGLGPVSRSLPFPQRAWAHGPGTRSTSCSWPPKSGIFFQVPRVGSKWGMARLLVQIGTARAQKKDPGAGSPGSHAGGAPGRRIGLDQPSFHFPRCHIPVGHVRAAASKPHAVREHARGRCERVMNRSDSGRRPTTEELSGGPPRAQ